MDDFYDDFDDEFSNGFGDDFSDDSDDGLEMDDPLVDDSGIEEESTDDDLCDDEFTTKEAVIFGMAMNFAYEEGLEESKRRRLEKKMNDKTDKKDNG